MEAPNTIPSPLEHSFPFFDTVHELRTSERLVLYDKLTEPLEEERGAIGQYLGLAFEEECLTYPTGVPAYEKASATWAAETLYVAAQLLLDRSQAPEVLTTLFPVYEGEIDARAMLSADLCLRFLPAVYLQAKEMDAEDPLLPILEAVFNRWPYSSIQLHKEMTLPLADLEIQHASLLQMFADRVIDYRADAALASRQVQEAVLAAVGAHSELFWPGLHETIRKQPEQDADHE